VCELGYYIHPDYQGKRIMYAACKEVLKYAANEFGIRKVLCGADVCNPASRRNIERLVKEYEDVVVTQKAIAWPPHKKVDGRDLNSVVTTWTFNIESYEEH
jgi:RimJ/RimL family protein N-acetyltransferase